MNRTEQAAQAPSPRTRPLAALAALLRAKGSGAPFSRPRLALAATLLTAALALPASAAAAPHDYLYSFGPDGSAATNFPHSVNYQGAPQLGFDAGSRGIYALDGLTPGIWGFDASTATPLSPLAGFAPLATPAVNSIPAMAIAVDNSGGPSQGNVYIAAARRPDNPGQPDLRL